MKVPDTLVSVVSITVAGVVMCVMLVVKWDANSVILVLVAASTNIPTLLNSMKIKQQLNGVFDDRMRAAFKAALLETGLFITDGARWYLRPSGDTRKVEVTVLSDPLLSDDPTTGPTSH